MTDRETIHLPHARQPEPALDRGPERHPEQAPVQIGHEKPATTDLAGNGAAGAEPQGSGESQDSGETAAANGANGSTAEIVHAETADEDEQAAPLWPGEESAKLSQRWERIQDAFVDEPRKAVEDADSLVASVATRIAEIFADERAKLEGQWDGDGEVSTEDLRIALLRYRAFFGRLLVI